MGLKEYSEAVKAFHANDLPLAKTKMAEALGADVEKLPDGVLKALVNPGPAVEDAVLRLIQIREKKRAS
jgi:hypothetical protein